MADEIDGNNDNLNRQLDQFNSQEVGNEAIQNDESTSNADKLSGSTQSMQQKTSLDKVEESFEGSHPEISQENIEENKNKEMILNNQNNLTESSQDIEKRSSRSCVKDKSLESRQGSSSGVSQKDLQKIENEKQNRENSQIDLNNQNNNGYENIDEKKSKSYFQESSQSGDRLNSEILEGDSQRIENERNKNNEDDEIVSKNSNTFESNSQDQQESTGGMNIQESRHNSQELNLQLSQKNSETVENEEKDHENGQQILNTSNSAGTSRNSSRKSLESKENKEKDNEHGQIILNTSKSTRTSRNSSQKSLDSTENKEKDNENGQTTLNTSNSAGTSRNSSRKSLESEENKERDNENGQKILNTANSAGTSRNSSRKSLKNKENKEKDHENGQISLNTSNSAGTSRNSSRKSLESKENKEKFIDENSKSTDKKEENKKDTQKVSNNLNKSTGSRQDKQPETPLNNVEETVQITRELNALNTNKGCKCCRSEFCGVARKKTRKFLLLISALLRSYPKMAESGKLVKDCECMSEDVTETACTGLCANFNRLLSAKGQDLESKLAKIHDKRDGDLKAVDSQDSITSFDADVDYLMRLEELMTIKHQTRHQLEELKRWERAYIKTLQSAGKALPEGTKEVDELRGHLEAKSSTNQQLAGRICELEDQVGSLKRKLLHCNCQVEKLSGKQRDTSELAASKNIQSKFESTDRAQEALPVIRNGRDAETMMEDAERINFQEPLFSSTKVTAQDKESFVDDSVTFYKSLGKEVVKLDETHKTNVSSANYISLESKPDEERVNLIRNKDTYDETSLQQFREVSEIVDLSVEKLEDGGISKLPEDKLPSGSKAAASSGLVELNRQELEKWLKNILDVLLTIRICQMCKAKKGQMMEVCEAICYKLGIKLLADDGKMKANEIEMGKLIEYQIQDSEVADIIEKEISTIGNHFEGLLTDQIDQTHSIRTHSLIKKASELAKLQLSEKPIDSAIGTLMPSGKEALEVYSEVGTGEEFIDSLPEISQLHSPPSTSTPIRRRREEMRSEPLEKSLNLSRHPSKSIKRQHTLVESTIDPTTEDGYFLVSKALETTQPEYESIRRNLETRIDIDKSVELPRVLSNSQVKISTDPSHPDQINSGAGRMAPAKGIKGWEDVRKYENGVERMERKFFPNTSDSINSRINMNFSESTRAVINKDVGKHVMRKIDENKEKTKIKEYKDKEIKMMEDRKEVDEFSGEIKRGKIQFSKKKYSTHDKEPITPTQSTSNTQEITKPSSIIPKSCCICPAHIGRPLITITRSQYERALALDGGTDCLAVSSRSQDYRNDSHQKAKQSRRKNIHTVMITVATQTTHRRRTSPKYLPDCKVCDCHPCGSETNPNPATDVNQVSLSTTLSQRPNKKNQHILAKLQISKR